MKRSHRLIRQAMQEVQEATRPQLRELTGLSLVAVNSAVDELCRSGELLPGDLIASGGGRPVRVYHYNKLHSQHAMFHLRSEGSTWSVKLELLDLHGTPRSVKEGRFSYIEAGSLDGWLDEAVARLQLRSITLYSGREAPLQGLAEHLRERYRCPVHTPSTAAILVPPTEGVAVISLPMGQAPTCAIYRGAQVHECGALELLPLPVRWQDLNHDDHTLKEELVAKLLQIISCTLAPQSIYLHTPAWSSRLMERIRYNALTKMRGTLPPIRFVPLTESVLLQALHRYAATRQ